MLGGDFCMESSEEKMKSDRIDKDEGKECIECKHSDAWMITLFHYVGRAKIQRTYCVGCFIKNAGLLRKTSK